MKRFVIKDISQDMYSVAIILDNNKRIDLPVNATSRTLKAGDKLGIMYDKTMDMMPMACFYKNTMVLMSEPNADMRAGFKNFVGDIKWYDMPRFYFATIKQVAKNGEMPRLRAWKNIQIMLSHGFAR